jgi:hypothetical protein
MFPAFIATGVGVRVLWFHLADLFLSITEASQCGFLGLGDKE